MTRRLPPLSLLAALALAASLPPALAADAPAAGPDRAAPDLTSMSADHQETSLVTGDTILTGHPQLAYGSTLLLTADEIRYNPRNRTASALGHAILTDGPRRLLADKIVYHQNDGTFEVGALRFGEFPVYGTGAGATGDRHSIVVNDARISVPEPGELVPTLEAARAYFTAGENVRVENAAVGLGGAQFLPFGHFERQLHDSLLSNVTASGGYRSSLGAYAILGVHVPVAPGLRLGGDLGIYTSRGLMAGPSGTYASTDGGASHAGSFRSGFIDDNGPRYTDLLGRPVPRHRGYAEWQHHQELTDRLTLTADVNYWSDSEVLRDFRPAEFFPVQQPDSYVESVYAGDNYFVSLFARFQPNPWQIVQQRLPELRFDLLPLALPGGFVERFDASVAVLREDARSAAPLNPAPGSDLRSDRFDAFYSLSRPIRPTDYFTFTPVIGGRITHYTDLTGAAVKRNDYTRTLGEIGVDAELHASGTWNYQNKRWGIDGLRHLLTPRVSYRYIPEAGKGAAYIPPIDRDVPLSSYLPPLDLGDERNLDTLHATNTLRVGLDNTLQTRDAVYGSRDLAYFNIADDLRFHRDPGERDVSEIHTELGLMPARWLELGVYESFAPQNFTLREFNTGVTLRNGDAWTLRFASNFRRDQLEDYLVVGRYRLNEVYEAITFLRYDARASRFVEQSYGVRQNIRNVWSVEYIVTLYSGDRRQSHFGFNVKIDTIRF
ncbi:MAG TPA: LPS assembly protein LptD [Opitutus sp.]|nr:LPS assembly protein LptD [Opitutus sp.]